MEARVEIIERLKLIFESFLQPNFANANNVCFDKLISHLSAKENEYILQAPFALEWVDKCISILSEDFSKVHPKVTSFMLNLCSFVMLNEWTLIAIKERDILARIITIMERDVKRFNPSIKLGCIRFLSTVSRYSLGTVYIRNSKVWRFLIDFCNQDHTLYVVREARQLIYELLFKFSVKAKDEAIVLEILGEIVRPVLDNVFQVEPDRIMINVDDNELQHRLSSTLDLFSYILQKTLESEEKTNLVHLCDKHFNIKFNLYKLLEMTKSSQFTEKVVFALTSFNFAQLVFEKWQSGQIAAEDFDQFGVRFFNMMKMCVTRGECLNFLKLAELNYILWKKLGERAPKEIVIESQRIRFENQLIILNLMPVLFLINYKDWAEEELFDKYIMKLFEISSEHTMRICYSYRDELFTNDGVPSSLIGDLACKSINGILSMQNILERDQAVILFQAITYTLKEFIYKSHPGTAMDVDCITKPFTGQKEEMVIIRDHPNVLFCALVGMQTLIQRYRITWKESIETICLVNFVAAMLDKVDLSSRLVVQALKLLQLALEHFLSPNMALLVDNLQGSGLVCMGPIIVKRCHDPEWEVRDSTLELVTSIASISRIKFPAFQQFLADFDICPLVYQMAIHDGEPYVRASALKCLAQMVFINAIWEKDLANPELIEHLFSVLYNESEGIVRKEAVSMLSMIFDQRKIPAQFKDTLYSTLAHCVVADLHWEVKVNALRCWELEIEKQFTNQGMIDGTFPTVTFSKEYKKIVTLTEKEINLRIWKVFNELSQRGCLGVILQCLHDDCDLEVIKAAVSMVYRLLEKLKKYDYEAIIGSMDEAQTLSRRSSEAAQPPKSNETTATNASDEVMPAEEPRTPEVAAEPAVDALKSDEVIEGILSSQDINLLVTTYERQMQLNGNVVLPSIDAQFYKKYANVSAKDFIGLVKHKDLKQLVHDHDEWFLGSESFSSLLDDILFSLKPLDGAIFADCY